MEIIKNRLLKKKKKKTWEDYVDINWMFVPNFPENKQYKEEEVFSYKHFEDIHAWIRKQREIEMLELADDNHTVLNDNLFKTGSFSCFSEELYEHEKYFEKRNSYDIDRNMTNKVDYVEIDTLSFSFLHTPL